MKIFTLYPTFTFTYKGYFVLYIRFPTPHFRSDTSQNQAVAGRLVSDMPLPSLPIEMGHFLLTIPHSIISAADPVTNGVANDVPVTLAYPPPGTGAVILTPGATRSGFG